MTYVVRDEFDFNSFNFWSGGYTVAEEIKNQGREEEAESLIVEYLGDSEDEPTDTEINDFVWFELSDMMDLYKENEEEDFDDDDDYED